jgi:hypothetical protein
MGICVLIFLVTTNYYYSMLVGGRSGSPVATDVEVIIIELRYES